MNDLCNEINNVMYAWNIYDYYDNYADTLEGYNYIMEHLKDDTDFIDGVYRELKYIWKNMKDNSDLENAMLYGFTSNDIYKLMYRVLELI